MTPDIHNLPDSYAYAAECQLGTLSEACYKKRTARWEITRHRDIALHMLLVCKAHRDVINWDTGPYNAFGRVDVLLRLDDDKVDGVTLHDVLNDYVRRCFRRGDDPREKAYGKWLKSWKKGRE